MKYNSVTIWHKTKSGYERKFFEKASIVCSCKMTGSAAEQLETNDAAVRVYTLYDCGISCGDKILFGYDEAPNPPDEAYIISEITGFFNVTASLRHYKIICG